MAAIRAWLIGVALLLPAAAQAQAGPAFDARRVSDTIRILSADDFAGRAPATPAETRTVAYLIARMKAAGLQPGGVRRGGGRGWTQPVPLLQAEIVGSPALAVTSGGVTRRLSQGREIAVRAALTGQATVALDRVPLVFVGYGVEAPERHWDDFKGIDLRGKIMVVLINDPDFEGGEGDFGGKAMTYYGRWTYKYEEAARQGAAGVLIVHESAPASYGWPTVRNSNTGTMFDIVRGDARAAHSPLEGWIQRDLAVDLFKASGLDFEAARKAAQRRDFRPVALTATLSADYAVRTRRIVSTNVVGRLPGRTRPDETVIYSAHWDHLGIGPADAKGDRIYNGARDNASGIAMLLELARGFARAPRTDRSLLFLALTAEESGLLGSAHYVAQPLYPLATTAGVINLDSVLGDGAARDFSIAGTAQLGLLDGLIADGARLGRRYTPDPRVEAGLFYRSDHFSFAQRGVPAISFKPGRDLLRGGTARGTALAEAYNRDFYHQPGDEWHGDWDLSGVVPDLTLLYALGRDLARAGVWPDWAATSEFRAARAATAAARRVTR